MALFLYFLAQLPTEAATVATDLAQRDFKWWVCALFGMITSGGIYIFKLQISQLAEQRKANTDLTTQLINYLRDDHTKATTTLDKVAISLEKITQVLVRFESHEAPPK